ncbi:MAG: glycoside hydrolase [Patescibacteria group bacterium]|nr:glycoside hydrolase [Patescibacteria group bacterium]
MNRRTFLRVSGTVPAGIILGESLTDQSIAGQGTIGSKDTREKKGVAWFEQTDPFIGGTEGYNTFRIPAIVVSPKGVILAFCEGRKYEAQDAGKIDLLLKRSMDGGRTWGPIQVIASGPDLRCGDPTPVIDRKTGAILLLYMKFSASLTVPDLLAGKGPKHVIVCKSTDNGATWSEGKEITAQVKGPGWDTYATGPCHGIQLTNGRIVIPCYHLFEAQTLENEGEFYASHLIYSDDGGENWKVGGVAGQWSDECTVEQTADGAIYVNFRYENKTSTRFQAWSYDNGETLTGFSEAKELIDPQCQGSVIRFTEEKRHGKNRILFVNLSSKTTRDHLRVRLSYDECKSWQVSKLVNEGPSGYSDLAIYTDQSVLCLYERGIKRYYERITFARFNLEWLTENVDHLF